MDVTVVIPVRNEEHLITQTLTMLLTQTVKPTAVIAVNNNSTDQTVARVAALQDQYAAHGIQLTTIDCTAGTQATARERGVAEVTTELIAFIDADTVLPRRWIEHGVHLFEQNESLVGTGGPMLYQQWVMTFSNFFLYCIVNMMRSRYFFYGCNGLFRLEAYKHCGGLAGCDAFMATHQHQEPYDDVWLSQRLRRVGRVKSYFRLYAQGTIRVSGTTATVRGAYQRWVRQRRETNTVLLYIHTEPTAV